MRRCPLIGLWRNKATSPRAPSCVSCGYALAGLDPGSRCPECALPIADSLGADPFPIMTERDVTLLTKGSAALVWSVLVAINAVAAAIAVMGLGVLTQSEGLLGVVCAGIMLGGAGVQLVLWILGWICIALVATAGAGPSAGAATVALRIGAYGQAIVLPPAFVWAGLASSKGHLAPLLVLAGIAYLVILIGQWRLATLCRRSRDPWLVGSSRDLLILLVLAIPFVAAAALLGPISPLIAASCGLVGAVFGVIGMVGWLGFLPAVRSAGERQLRGSAA